MKKKLTFFSVAVIKLSFCLVPCLAKNKTPSKCHRRGWGCGAQLYLKDSRFLLFLWGYATLKDTLKAKMTTIVRDVVEYFLSKYALAVWSDLEVVIIDSQKLRGKSLSLAWRNRSNMLGENLEIAPPPFRNMLEDAKKHAERNIVSKQTLFQQALECKVEFNKPYGTFPPMSTVSRIQTESPGLPNGSLNLPGNTNNVEKVLIKHYFMHFMRFYRRSSTLNNSFYRQRR